jgi:hypothetical protein
MDGPVPIQRIGGEMNTPKQDDQPTDREAVLARWPTARRAHFITCAQGRLSGYFRTEALAWADARAKLAQPEASEGGDKDAIGARFKGPHLLTDLKGWTAPCCGNAAGCMWCAREAAYRLAPTPPATAEPDDQFGNNESARRVAAVKGACARAAGFAKDTAHGYSGRNKESWKFGWEYCEDCLRDPNYKPRPAEPVGGVEQAELPPLPFIVPDEYLRDAYKLRGLGTDISFSHQELQNTWFKLKMREDQYHAEITAHNATRAYLKGVEQTSENRAQALISVGGDSE